VADQTADWSTVADLIERVTRRWARGTWLSAYAAGEPFEPVTVVARTPTAADLVERTADAQAWVQKFRNDAARRPRIRVAYKTLRNRAVGANEVPAAVCIDSFEALVATIGVGAVKEGFDRAVAMTEATVPEATAWVRRHPLQVAAVAGIWPQLISALRWVIDHDVSQLDLRHIDTPGVDSKFLTENRHIVRPLLDAVLPPERVRKEFTELDKRYGFRTRPTYARLRFLGNDIGIPSALTEVELRVDELAQLPLPVTTVFVVENRATFNSFPDLADSVVVFGGGYAVSVLGGLDWLHERRLVYWGDIDTHGFRILSRLRGLFAHCESMLMDTRTLLANLERIVDEPSPLTEQLDHLTMSEAQLYQALREDRYGSAVRLEQERIPLDILRTELAPHRA
jgi:hypothetical protein